MFQESPSSAQESALKAAVGNNWEQFDELCDISNKGLPVEMRNAERRSPYVGWSGPEEARRRTAYTFTWTGDTMILRPESVSGRMHEWGRWSRENLKEMAEFLAARKIRVTGMPTPEDAGGFPRLKKDGKTVVSGYRGRRGAYRERGYRATLAPGHGHHRTPRRAVRGGDEDRATAQRHGERTHTGTHRHGSHGEMRPRAAPHTREVKVPSRRMRRDASQSARGV